MRRLGLLASLLLCPLTPVRAAELPTAKLMVPIALETDTPQKACTDAIAASEAAHGIPAGFLLAIALVESGRPDRQTGRVIPWPWTADFDGVGSFFGTRSEVVAAVEARQSQGLRSIDVGCLQVNLQQHPAAFRSLPEAFDPKANADYAARFLVSLRQESGDWTIAAGLYHSRTEAIAAPYRKAVAWRFGGANPSAPVARHNQPAEAMATAWAATLGQGDADLAKWEKAAKPLPPRGVPTARDWQLTSR